MRFSPISLGILALASCGNKPAPTTPTSADASDAAVASKECMAARDQRAKGTALRARGHETLALAKLDEANAAGAAERDTSKELEAALLAYAARWDAPSKGTED